VLIINDGFLEKAMYSTGSTRLPMKQNEQCCVSPELLADLLTS